MATKNQLTYAVSHFVDDMIPQAEGNYKIILRAAKAALNLNPNKMWDVLQNNEFVKMLGVIHDGTIELDNLESILVEALGQNEFELKFRLFGNEYKIFVTSNDVRKLKNYAMEVQA